MSAKSTVDLFNGLLAGLKENDKLKAQQLSLQPPVMAQQQVPQVQIPMAPPSPQELFQQNMDPAKLVPVDMGFIPQYTPESFDGIGMVPPVNAGQVGIPTMPSAAPLPNSENFVLRPPEQAVLGQEPEGLPRPTMSIGQVPQLGGNVPQVTDPNFLNSMPQGPAQVSQEELARYQSVDPFNLTSQEEIPEDGFNVSDLFKTNLGSRSQSDRLTSKSFLQPKQDIPEDGFNVSDLFKTNLGSRSQSDRLTNESFLQPKQDIEGVKTRQAAEDVADREDLVSGKLSVTQYERKKAKREAELRDSQEKQTISERQTLGILTSRANKLEAAGLLEEANQVRSQIPKPEGSEIPKAEQKLLDGEPAVDLTPTQPTGTGTTQPAATGGSGLTLQDAEEAEAVIPEPVKKDADALIKKTGKVPTGDEPPEEKEGFLKKLWGGMKDMFKEGMEDPTFRKTLFAYVGSRALGYDGVTFAGQVLENEWAKQAKQLDRDLELEKIYGKGAVAAAKKAAEDNEIDYSKASDIYDSTNQRNISGSFSKDGKMIALDDADFYASLPQIEDPDNPGVMMSIPVGTPLGVEQLRRYNNGQFKVGTGKTGTEANQEMADRMTTFLDQGVSRLVSNAEAAGADSTDAKKLESLLKNKATASTLNSASMVYRSLFPPGTDFSTSEMDSILANGVDKWLDSIAAGREGNAKSLGAFLEREHIKLNATNRISDEFFIVPKLGGEIDNTGAETWIKASGRVKELASALGAASPDGKAPEKARVWALAERLYKQQEAEHGPAFTKHWLAESDASSKNKGKAASPALLYVLSIGTKTQGKAKPKFYPGTNAEVLARFKKLGK